jgi:hypothetical protein
MAFVDMTACVVYDPRGQGVSVTTVTQESEAP